jgi:hypothetical protein
LDTLTKAARALGKEIEIEIKRAHKKSLLVSEDGSLLRVATYGRGIWEINP